jgi:hypothetical protein
MSDELVAVVDGEVTLKHSGAHHLVVRKQIMDLTYRLLNMPGEHIELPVEHHFVDGMYLRKLFIKKGAFLIGKIHRKECFNIVAKGDITVLTESGCMRVTEGLTIASPSGLQKVGIAHEDTIFINVFRAEEKDIAELEDEISCETFEALEALTIEGVESCQ